VDRRGQVPSFMKVSCLVEGVWCVMAREGERLQKR